MLPIVSSLFASFLLVVTVNPGTAQEQGPTQMEQEPTQMEQVAAHLQLLGFEPEDRGEVLGVRHAELPSFVVRESENGIMVTTFFKGKEAAQTDRAGFLGLVNDMNQTSILVRCFVSNEGDLGVEAWLPGGYERELFARFLDAWHKDLQAVLTLDNEATARYLN